MPSVAVSCVNAFLLSLVLILAMEKIARRIGLVDVPSERKHHEGRIPLVGAAMFLAFCIASLLLQRQPPGFVDLFIGLLLIVSLGVIDDLFDLRAPVKLVAQSVCVALMVLPNDLLIRNAGALFSDQPLLLLHWAVPATIFAVVGLVNAINMIDGLDGLAGGVSLVALAWFAVAAGVLGLSDELLLILVLACSALGFLVFNVRHPWRARAVVFLGDAGSMMLGLSLAFVAIKLSQRSGPALSPVAALWICALPVIDTLSLMVRRAAAGQGLLSSDHRHLHDLMVRAGLSVNQAVLVLVSISAILGGVGVGGWLLGVPDRVMLFGLGIAVLVHTWFSCHGWKHLRPVKGEVVANAGPIAQLEPWTK
jgi:UDP-GlcNAc:undecaprenyl-phosphate/decaprenyl-phosphate GlcNAc-1-phosphate transferase